MMVWTSWTKGVALCALAAVLVGCGDSTAPTPNFALVVTRDGGGTGTVTSDPAGIDCGTSCSGNFASGTQVTLTATPGVGSTFDTWSGACQGPTLTCAVTMEAATAVVATFSLQTLTLTVVKQGQGTGTVTSSPAAIDCGSTCEHDFTYGTTVTLTADPGDAVFAGWSGACTGASPTCEVTLTANTAAIATFTLPACSWDNGGMVTHPGAGSEGAHVSMASPVDNTGGSTVRFNSPEGPHFRIADNFVVAVRCFMTEIVTYAHETNQATPTWTRANINVRSTSITGTVVANTTTTNWSFAGVYRVFNGEANLANTARAVHRIVFGFDNAILNPGTYWIDWQVEGGTSGFATYVMEPDPQGGSNTTTVFGNGQQMVAGGVWQVTLSAPGAEVPFLVRGPGAPALANYGAPAASAASRQAVVPTSAAASDRQVP